MLISSTSQRVKVRKELTEKKVIRNKNPMLSGTFLIHVLRIIMLHYQQKESAEGICLSYPICCIMGRQPQPPETERNRTKISTQKNAISAVLGHANNFQA